MTCCASNKRQRGKSTAALIHHCAQGSRHLHYPSECCMVALRAFTLVTAYQRLNPLWWLSTATYWDRGVPHTQSGRCTCSIRWRTPLTSHIRLTVGTSGVLYFNEQQFHVSQVARPCSSAPWVRFVRPVFDDKFCCRIPLQRIIGNVPECAQRQGPSGHISR